MINVEWFKEHMLPSFKGYELVFKFFEQGDFGSLNQVEFNSKTLGGNIDFWQNKWVGIFVVDYVNEKVLYNALFTDEQQQEISEAFEKLKMLLQK